MTDKYTQFTTVSYGGRKLLEKHPLSTQGFWQIKGEDANCDFGGHHYQPDLGTVEGSLEEVIRYAVDLLNFWTWGGGGTITLIETKKISWESNDLKTKLLAEQLSLKAALKKVEDQLNMKA